MNMTFNTNQLTELGLDQQTAERLIEEIKTKLENIHTNEEAWQAISQHLLTSAHPFAVHLFLFSSIFPHWQVHPETAPAWLPTANLIKNANISQFMAEINIQDVKKFHHWTTHQYQNFWPRIIEKLKIKFKKDSYQLCDLVQGIESPQWFPGATMNIVDSCFTAPDSNTAIIYEEKNHLCKLSYRELNELSNRIANSLIQIGFMKGDAIGIAMPMNTFAIAIYLGIIKMGGMVVSIADSFSSQEIAIRLKIAKAKAIFTQDVIHWSGKELPLYEKVCHANAPKAIVLSCSQAISLPLRPNDLAWTNFLVADTHFTSVACAPMTPCNILFSSGTTADPKAIPWNHTTAIKAASDAYLHQNVQANDVLAWPTNLGWMMGPWLIFAALINHAAIALYSDAPKDRAFGEFIERAKVTMLGVVPTLVATWRQSQCMENLDWSTIKVFSSTGECSNPEDMLYLMSLAGYKPVIEYCGGTEIGGAYITSTVIQNNYPSLFSTAAMGLDLVILDETGNPADIGEVAIIPPSIGLSTQLLNTDHHNVYFANMPLYDGKLLRRHGDQIKRLTNGYYTILGRADDTMNLGGIKISAAEIERAVIGIPDVIEVAAIAISPLHFGPSQLIIYASTKNKLNKENIQKEMQKRINFHLNPLFKIHDIVLTNELPKTASNKIMRRVLRKQYEEQK